MVLMWQGLARTVERHYDVWLIHRTDWEGVLEHAAQVNAFCDHSGFLRDGRYPGGRHAERKIRKRVVAMCLYADQGSAGPWLDWKKSNLGAESRRMLCV